MYINQKSLKIKRSNIGKIKQKGLRSEHSNIDKIKQSVSEANIQI